MFTPSQNKLSETFVVCAEGDDRFFSNYKFNRPVCAGVTQKQMFTPPSVRSTLVCGSCTESNIQNFYFWHELPWSLRKATVQEEKHFNLATRKNNQLIGIDHAEISSYTKRLTPWGPEEVKKHQNLWHHIAPS